ncbi:MAG: cache domain-containing protein, partial [Defluviitaleaceae bacterium]|nr:cache domain-containing protein [Defluviitaleaceae bacterium]
IMLAGIFALLVIAFVLNTQRSGYNSVVNKLTATSEGMRLRLSTEVNGEIILAKKMAGSPVIRRWFMNPDDAQAQRDALEEFESYRNSFRSRSLLWVNDTDRLCYSHDRDPYPIDPDLPSNYWYNMTLHKTETYNFNINYSPDLKETYLWINIPVRSDEGKPLGMVGIPIGIGDFLESVLMIDDSVSLLMFNRLSEITVAGDAELVSGKVSLQAHLGDDGVNIASIAENLADAEIHVHRGRGVVYCVSSVPFLEWYLVCGASTKFSALIDPTITNIFLFIFIISAVTVVAFNMYVSKLNRAVESQYDALLLANRKVAAGGEIWPGAGGSRASKTGPLLTADSLSCRVFFRPEGVPGDADHDRLPEDSLCH